MSEPTKTAKNKDKKIKKEGHKKLNKQSHSEQKSA